ncbi:MAG: nicotinate phosphoribosyltransferase, partial [Candidatus Niyogibacteria bacterium]|nr:nicotinate phosphoribosyltransferase [Candidatus Niyogibacteria bacterium]
MEMTALYARAQDRIYTKLEKLAAYPQIRFADFGQRRRHSFGWQQWVVGLAKDMLKGQFTGTSNTWMAFHYDLVPIGTNAHELPMVLTALADSDFEKRMAQYRVLEHWERMYGEGLRIFLPDTYGTEQFLSPASEALSRWRGFRQDSGDPISRGEVYIAWLEKLGVDPKDKLIIFSDGLDADRMIELHNHFSGRIKTVFGWGTLLTNDFRGCYPKNPLFRPFSMVCKVVAARENGDSEWRPCVKLSDNIQKATGPKDEIERYVRIFGHAGRTDEKVLV